MTTSLRDQLRLDKDTRGVPGSPPIFQTILHKIDAAAVFVADLTICSSRQDGRLSPNPNVLIEYGYALKSLGHHRLIAVMNIAHGKPSRESLPFNLADRRFPIVYDVPDDSSDEIRHQARDKLAKELEVALREVLQSAEFKAGLARDSEPPQFVRVIKPLHGSLHFDCPPDKIAAWLVRCRKWPINDGPGYNRYNLVVASDAVERAVPCGARKTNPQNHFLAALRAFNPQAILRKTRTVSLCSKHPAS